MDRRSIRRRLLIGIIAGLDWGAGLTIGGGLAAAEPLATAGTDHAQVTAALHALGAGDPGPVLGLPLHLLSEPPALTDPADPALARRWTELLGRALARLPADAPARAAIAGRVPQPDAAAAAARAFDRGRLIDVLLLAPEGVRGTAARALLGLGAGTLPVPALPVPGMGIVPVPTPARLISIGGWLLGLDPDGRVRWQRTLARSAQVVLGDDAAMVAQVDGAATIDLDGERHPLPPLPAFAKPLAIHGSVAWFGRGARLWRLTLANGVVAGLTLPEPPQGPPLLRGDDAWWLGRTTLLQTHGVAVAGRLPHLLALSAAAALRAYPRGAVIVDGPRWWLVGPRREAPLRDLIEATLLAGDRAEAKRLLDDGPALDDGDLAVRVTRADARTPQQRALLALVTGSGIDRLDGNPLLTEPGTDLDLPVWAWPHRCTLAAWRSSDDRPPEVTTASDGATITLRAAWSTERWWERRWPTRPALDAPGRSSAVTADAVVVLDGATHLLVADRRTGRRIVEADVPAEVDPSQVARLGDTAVAALADGGRTVLIIRPAGSERRPCPLTGTAIHADQGRVIVTAADGRTWQTTP